MEPSEPLRNLLTDLAQAFNGGDRVPVKFPGEEVEMEEGETATAPAGHYTTPTGTVVVNPDVNDHYGVEMDPPNQLRLLVDALHHEIEHVRETELTEKGDLADDHSEAAATIFNLVEDQYINRTRTTRHRGRRRDLAFKAEHAVWPQQDDVSTVPPAQGLPAALSQLCWNGRVKGFSGLDDEHKKFLAWARQEIEAARHADDQADRVEAAKRIADRLEDHVDRPDWDDLPEWLKDAIEGDGGFAVEAEGDDDEGGGEPGADGLGAELEDAEDDEEDAGAGEGESGDEAPDEDADGEGGATGDDSDDAGEDGDLGDLDDDLADEVEDLEAADQGDDGTAQAKSPHDGDPEYDPPETYVERWERVKQEEERQDTDLGYYERKRDHLLGVPLTDNYPLDDWDPYLARYDNDRPDQRSADTPIAEVRDNYDGDLARDVAEAFKRFKTRPTEQTSRDGPRLDRGNVVRHLAGERGLPLHRRREGRQAMGDRVVGVAMDCSGSMSSSRGSSRRKIETAKLALGAVAEACETIGDEFVATGFRTTTHSYADLDLITGPDEPFEWEQLDAIRAGGAETPAQGALFTRDLMERAGGREKVLIVIHDGKPHTGLTGGEDDATQAVEDMARTVNQLRSDGIRVIGLGVGDGINEESMADMFGSEGWLMCDTDAMVQTLIDVYEQQLDVGERR